MSDNAVRTTSGWAVAGFVVGLLAAVFVTAPLVAIVVCAAGVTSSVIGLRSPRRRFAVFGIAIAGVVLVATVIILVMGLTLA